MGFSPALRKPHQDLHDTGCLRCPSSASTRSPAPTRGCPRGFTPPFSAQAQCPRPTTLLRVSLQPF